jgi:transcriptional regulator CtsR
MKKSLADRIEQYLKVLIARSEENQIEIQRSELAETFSCVPSQVTYVINTRFTEQEGYFTESRRGGKGFVRITRCQVEGELLGSRQRTELCRFIDNLLADQLISQEENLLLKHLITNAFVDFAPDQKSRLFKSIKNTLTDYLEQD